MAMTSPAASMAPIAARGGPGSRLAVSPAASRALLSLLVLAGCAAGFLATGAAAEMRALALAGADLARLLRAMAGIKALAACGLIGVVWWRLGAAIAPGWLCAYAVAATAAAAAPGLIWGLVHVAAGAGLLHGGILALLLLLWRDPAVPSRLSAAVRRRRAAIRG